jgi:hypothetical protein
MRRSPILLEGILIRILIQLWKQPVFQHGNILFGTGCIILLLLYWSSVFRRSRLSFIWSRNYLTFTELVA